MHGSKEHEAAHAYHNAATLKKVTALAARWNMLVMTGSGGSACGSQ